MRLRQWVWALAAGALVGLTGCAGFFVANSTSTTSTSSSGDYVYVVNQSANTLTGYVVGTGTLTLITGSPYTLASGLSAASVAVTRPDTYVYVGGVGGIVCYSIGTNGALTAVSGGGISVQGAVFVSLDTSVDGKWLFALDSTLNELYVFGINTSTGALAAATPVVTQSIVSGSNTAKMVRISPNDALVAVALSYGGTVTYNFNTTTGSLTFGQNIATTSSGQYDNAVAFDTTSAYLMIARGAGSAGSNVLVYAVNANGVATSGPNTTASGNTPYALLEVSTSAGTFAYAANRGDSTISGYTFASGALTAQSNGTYGSGSAVDGLVVDKTGDYVISSASGGGQDVTLYAYDAVTSGRLDAVATATSGAAGLAAIAATH
jgi:6-phosphogluconolactonase (cycloisomerase 2 family)